MNDPLEWLKAENQRLTRQLGNAGIVQLVRAQMPSSGEVVQLHSKVVHVYPQLQCARDQFELCLLHLSYVQRRPTLNSQYWMVHWVDAADRWLKAQGHPHVVTLNAFYAAAIASNIPFADPVRAPHDLEVGINDGTVSRPVNGWRHVLQAKALPAPTPLNRPTPTVLLEHDVVQFK